MRVQDFIASQTEIITNGLMRAVRALPADKLEWKPYDNGRSAMDQLRECATSPEVHIRSLVEGKYEYSADLKTKRAALTTVDQAEKALREGTAELAKVIRELPDSRLQEKVALPWGDTWTLVEVANMHYWNLVYHVGQINYIQTLLGDFEMH